jgi:hypothetical protein
VDDEDEDEDGVPPVLGVAVELGPVLGVGVAVEPPPVLESSMPPEDGGTSGQAARVTSRAAEAALCNPVLRERSSTSSDTDVACAPAKSAGRESVSCPVEPAALKGTFSMVVTKRRSPPDD